MAMWRRAARGAVVWGAVAGLAGACHSGPHVTFTVSTTADGADASPGDGVCEMTAGEGDCSPRGAIMESNATDAGTTTAIELTGATTYTLTLPGVDAIGSVGDLDITRDVTLNGHGATIRGGDAIPVFEVHAGTLAVTGATLIGNAGTSFTGDLERSVGGALLNHANAQLTDVSVTGTADGGGVAIHQTAGTTTLLRSRVTDNRPNILAGSPWAAVWIEGGTLNVADSEIKGNYPENRYHNRDNAGITIQSGTARILRSTISSHGATIFLPVAPYFAVAAGKGIDNNGTVEIVRSTVAGNTTDIAGTGSVVISGSVTGTCTSVATSLGFNLDRDSSCLGTGEPTDLHSAATVLDPLGFHGGPTRVHLPAAASPIVDSIPLGTPSLCDGTLPTDQRGLPRPVGVGCDRGAVERQADDP